MWFFGNKEEKEQKKIDKKNQKVMQQEQSIQNRIDLLHQKKDLAAAQADSSYMDQHLTKEDLRNAIDTAREDLYITRDELYSIINISSKEVNRISSKGVSTPGNQQRKKQLETKIKNSIYALTLVQQTIDRLNDMMSEYEWRQAIRNLTNGYKVINEISTGSNFGTRLMFRIQKMKMNIKGATPIDATTDYFGKNIDHTLETHGMSDVATGVLVNVNTPDLKEMDRDELLDAARDGLFVSIQPEELNRLAEEEQMEHPDESNPDLQVDISSIPQYNDPNDYQHMSLESKKAMMNSLK